MKFIRPILTLAVFVLTAVTPFAASLHARTWESMKTERSDARSVARETDIEVKTASGILIVSTNVRTSVKVYTILGQLVSSETIGPGTLQYRVGAHGVYIVKVGSLTCKVAL